jgi:hypothetical protein
MRLMSRPALLLLLGINALPLGVVACGKSEPKAEKPNFFPPEPERPKLDMSDIVVEQEDTAPPPSPDTWGGQVKLLVAEAEADLQRCRNEFLIPFQFNTMKRRDVMFVDINLMSEVCMAGSKEKKARGPQKILDQLAKEHLGRNAVLDQFIIHGLEQVETYRVFDFMTKKVGAPDIDMVVDIAQKSQQRILEAAPQLDRAAAEVAKLADATPPDDDVQVAGAAVDVAAFKQQLVTAYGPVVADLASGYERMADKSWKDYNLPKLDTLQAMGGVLQKRAQQDRARLAKVSGLDDKGKAEFEAFFAAAEAAAKQVESGFAFYRKPKDERGDRDPNTKAVQSAQKGLAKTLSGWGWSAGEK